LNVLVRVTTVKWCDDG